MGQEDVTADFGGVFFFREEKRRAKESNETM